MLPGTAKKRIAKITATLTDCVDIESLFAENNGKNLSIQVSIVWGGVAYEGLVPVRLKVNKSIGTVGPSHKK